MSSSVRRSARAVVAVVTAMFLAGGVGACSGSAGTPQAMEPTAGASTPSGPPTPIPSPASAKPKPGDPLTGGGKVSGNPVIAAKVENTSAARPQVGLSQADIVFVEEVEGAQTRLVAVYHSRLPTRVGPVRSARTTDAQLLPLFGKPGLVYSGANARVQRTLDRASLVPVFRLTRDRRRTAPHNVFVDLRQVARTGKLGKAQSIGWTFTDKPSQRGPQDDTATAKVGNDTFGFAYAKGRYTVTWRGARYVDGDNGAVTKADNIVVMRVRNVPDGNRDVLGSASVLSETVGRGKVTVHRDGVRIDGTWSRAKSSAPLQFTDGNNQDIALKPGQTWVTLQG